MYTPPAQFNDFFIWFREMTEATWEVHQPRTLEQQRSYGVGGTDWRNGTKWGPGLTTAEIAKLEDIEGRPFPQEYRSFLSILGSPDRSEISFSFKGAEMVQGERSSFPNWLNQEDISARRSRFSESILFDVKNGIWLEAWGNEPINMSEKLDLVSSLIREAPPLLPVWSHRAIPCVQSEHPLPVLSIYQTDAIILADSLRDALLLDFSYLVGVSRAKQSDAPIELPDEYGFWRDLVVFN